MDLEADARRDGDLSHKSRLPASPSPASAPRNEAQGHSEVEMTDEVDDLLGQWEAERLQDSAEAIASVISSARGGANPTLGMCFLDIKVADAYTRMAGAQTASYRIIPGGSKTQRAYCCR
jgi:hypothetical protein